MAFILSIIVAGLYRAYTLPRWMIWAFTNVRNVHELRRRAAYALLLPREQKHFLRKLEIWTVEQKRDWEQLQLRFDQEDDFIDDPTVPVETRVYFSVIKRVLVQPVYIVMILFGAFPLVIREADPLSLKAIWQYLFGLVFAFAGIALTWINIRQMMNRNPQIIMNSSGLTVAGKPFHSWSVIRDLHIVPRGIGKQRKYYLEYFVPGDKIAVELDAFSMSRSKLDQYLHLYQSRGLQQSKFKDAKGYRKDS